MPSPYDIFGRPYPSAVATLPSPDVRWIETNTLGLNFIPPVGEPEKYNQLLADKPNGPISVWQWHTGSEYVLSPSTPLSQLLSPPQVSITITGKGGSFNTGNLNLAWNNENAWSGLQTFSRSNLGGIDLDWMIVGCNAVVMPYPTGQMAFEDVLGTYDLFLAIGYKIVTPGGASQFFYPGARELFLQSEGGPNNSGLYNIKWVPTDLSKPQVYLNTSLPEIPSSPIIPISEVNTSPYVQLPMFGGTYGDVYMEGAESAGNSIIFPPSGFFYVSNIQTPNAYSVSFEQWEQGAGPYFIDEGSVLLSYEPNAAANKLLCIQAGLNPGTNVVAYGNVNFQVNSVTPSAYLAYPAGSSGGYSWPNLYNFSPVIKYTAFVDTSGPLSYVWGGVPGGSGVIPPSNPTNGVGELLWWDYSNNVYSIPGSSPTATPGLWVLPTMQVPVGPDTFLVSF